MKRRLFVAAFAGTMLVYACGSSAEANNMADEMCVAMEKYKEHEPMSMLDAANDMAIILKKEAYGKVKESELKKAMMKKCPEGWRKFEALKGK